MAQKQIMEWLGYIRIEFVPETFAKFALINDLIRIALDLKLYFRLLGLKRNESD